MSHPEPPTVVQRLVRTPVDAFIHQKLAADNLTMSKEADRRTLIRRVSYSLTGLPPTAEDVQRFVHDSAPNAYESLVERLLASPAHGEHWARHWLDVARYSDTKGYVYAREERFWVHAWNYRDWVVNALNSDMAYDRFLLLQIAADQVEDRRDDDLAAMGFLTLGRRFLGVRRDIIDDRIDVVCRGTMSLTVGCARCHDHKYDPIPTADYYSLYGVFDSSLEQLVELPKPDSADAIFEKALAEKKGGAGFIAAGTTAVNVRTASIASRRLSVQAQLELSKYPEEGFDQIIATTDLLPSFVHRWRDYLRDCEKTGDPVFAAWHAFRKIPAAEFGDRAQVVSLELSQLGANQLNPNIAAAFASPPSSFANVVERYAAVFKQTDESWQAELEKAKTSGVPRTATNERSCRRTTTSRFVRGRSSMSRAERASCEHRIRFRFWHV